MRVGAFCKFWKNTKYFQSLCKHSFKVYQEKMPTAFNLQINLQLTFSVLLGICYVSSLC